MIQKYVAPIAVGKDIFGIALPVIGVVIAFGEYKRYTAFFGFLKSACLSEKKDIYTVVLIIAGESSFR